ncbi:Transposon Tf2-9 polyprotein [Dictyocoela muelleri]|nr:Transposon Tf2-9 polyprotein [Dictyocoela muelleri]
MLCSICISAQNISEIFNKNLLKYFPIPKEIIMDNGTQFRSSTFSKILKSKNIKAFLYLLIFPQPNGISERLNQKILNAIRTFEGNDFYKIEKIIWQSFNLTPNRSTGFAPLEILNCTEIISKNSIKNLKEILEKCFPKGVI